MKAKFADYFLCPKCEGKGLRVVICQYENGVLYIIGRNERLFRAAPPCETVCPKCNHAILISG